MLAEFLGGLTGSCARHARLVAALALALAAASVGLAATHLHMSTNLHELFDARLPWLQHDLELRQAYPQFDDLIVALVDGDIPEEADATADGLVQALSGDTAHFRLIRRPDISPYLRRQGLLFLDTAALSDVLDKTIDAAPLLGQLAADPSARGLFAALGLIGQGVARGQADLAPFATALRGFHVALDAAVAGRRRPLSWQRLLGGKLAELAGPDRIVLIQPKLDYGAVQPGGEATRIIRTAASRLEFVAGGQAHIRLTGAVPLADEEFSSAMQGAASGLAISFSLVVVWLFLALRSWRLIVPVAITLVLGLLLTTGFAALAVGTLNLISVGFAILFVGIAVDFAIQFCVRLREIRTLEPLLPAALVATGRRVGRQVLVAGVAAACGFLAFVPTSFRGVAELGLIAGVGMLVALACTLTVLPALLVLGRPAQDTSEVGIAALASVDRLLARWRTPLLGGFILLFVAGGALTFRLNFDSNTLHTKQQGTEAMRTLLHLFDNPLTNPFTIDIVRPNAAAAAALAGPIGRLPLVDHVVGLQSFVPDDQPAKLAIIQDARAILAPVLAAGGIKPVDATELRQAAARCLSLLQPALARLAPTDPLAAIAGDLRALQAAPDATLLAANTALVRFLPAQLNRLRTALTAMPVGPNDVPADIRRDYVQANGAARLQVVPKAAVLDSTVLRRFVAQVQQIAPDAGGAAVTIVATADTILAAFRQAAIGAVVAIGVILLLFLGRPVDAALVLAPLLLSAAMTVIIIWAAGMTLNYANIIALPLLLGVGVSFNVYFIMNWRAGAAPKLSSATARAVIFSALTTGTAFGSLAVSAHPGTASMGLLLLISLGCTLVGSLIFVPALLWRTPQTCFRLAIRHGDA